MRLVELSSHYRLGFYKCVFRSLDDASFVEFFRVGRFWAIDFQTAGKLSRKENEESTKYFIGPSRGNCINTLLAHLREPVRNLLGTKLKFDLTVKVCEINEGLRTTLGRQKILKSS